MVILTELRMQHVTSHHRNSNKRFVHDHKLMRSKVFLHNEASFSVTHLLSVHSNKHFHGNNIKSCTATIKILQPFDQRPLLLRFIYRVCHFDLVPTHSLYFISYISVSTLHCFIYWLFDFYKQEIFIFYKLYNNRPTQSALQKQLKSETTIKAHGEIMFFKWQIIRDRTFIRINMLKQTD